MNASSKIILALKLASPFSLRGRAWPSVWRPTTVCSSWLLPMRCPCGSGWTSLSRQQTSTADIDLFPYKTVKWGGTLLREPCSESFFPSLLDKSRSDYRSVSGTWTRWGSWRSGSGVWGGEQTCWNNRGSCYWQWWCSSYLNQKDFFLISLQTEHQILIIS